MANDLSDTEHLLERLRGGDSQALSDLFERHRNRLRRMVELRMDARLQGRVDASDVVQETFLDACRDFDHFRGSSPGEWAAWLRKILLYNLARVVQRQVVAQKRSARREVSLDQHVAVMDRSSGRIEAALVGRSSSPSSQAQRSELAARVADQLARLSPDYREVLVLRNLEGLPFPEVARRMDRSPGAVRILWVRAVDQLRQVLQAEELV